MLQKSPWLASIIASTLAFTCGCATNYKGAIESKKEGSLPTPSSKWTLQLTDDRGGNKTTLEVSWDGQMVFTTDAQENNKLTMKLPTPRLQRLDRALAALPKEQWLAGTSSPSAGSISPPN